MDGAALFEVEKVARQAWEAAVRWGAQTGDADRETSLTLVAVQGDKWCVLRSLAGGLERTLGEWRHSTGLSPLIMEVRTQPGRAHAREMVACLFAVRDDSNSGCGLFVIAWCCMTLFLGTQEWSLLAPAGGNDSRPKYGYLQHLSWWTGERCWIPLQECGQEIMHKSRTDSKTAVSPKPKPHSDSSWTLGTWSSLQAAPRFKECPVREAPVVWPSSRQLCWSLLLPESTSSASLRGSGKSLLLSVLDKEGVSSIALA